ncbi:protein kinase domain-containing protein [Ditylenchus destructor]|nr:protein kinase domain-containing protein [Ditylenchus destructor]
MSSFPGSFSRVTNNHRQGGSGSGGSFSAYRPTIRRRGITVSQHGSLSQNDSFDSTGSGQHASPLISCRGSIATTSLGVSTGPVPSLQRSHSDAQECRSLRKNYQASGSSSRVLLNEHHLNRIRKMRRRPSNSLRGGMSSAMDFLNTSLDSNGSGSGQYSQHHLLPHHYQPNHHMSSHHSNLLRLRLSPLGHSDPQLYTATQHSNGFLGVTGRRSAASGGGRRSFLSASPLNPKLRKASFLASPPHHSSQSGSGHAHGHRPHIAAGSSHHNHHSSGSHHAGPFRIRVRSSTSAIHSSGVHAGIHSHHHTHVPGPRGSFSGALAGSSGVPPKVAMRAGSSLAAPALDNRRWSLASLPSSSGYGTPGTGSNSAFSSQYSSQEHLADMISDLRVNSRFDSNESYSCFEDAILGFRPRSRSLTSPVRGGSDYSTGDHPPPPIMSMYKERFPKAKTQMENRLQQFLLSNAPLSGFSTSMILNVLPNDDSPQPGRPTSPHPPSREYTPPQGASHHHHHRPSSPRPTSPIPRPISPLVTESATVIGDAGVVLRSSAHHLHSSSNNLSISPGSSFLYGNQSQSALNTIGNTNNNSNSGSGGTGGRLSHRCSFMVAGDGMAAADPSLLRLISDGATRFLHHQMCEIVADCLQKSREDLLTCAYFCQMSVRLDETLAEAEVKTGPDSYKYLARLVRQILMIVSRTARLLECLEFDPDEFYQLLEEAEGSVRVQLGSGTARVPDLPQYIISKLGLNKNLLMDQEGAEELSPEEKPKVADRGLKNAPKEEDFESIRLISNGAYGAVYLVRHKKTRQRFALKKMKKQTLLLRNQVDQVYAERDILTFTDNPFVVCFYGSFETKQHLCMLMEYVEGGDCAALLKSAGTLPIELARLYVAETVLAIEYLHSCGIVHRDLKPDNLLITAMGHIKLTDFGLSKIGLMNRTTLVSEGYMDDTQQFKDNQLCGTPEYIAPECILRQGYGKPVDWWALGIILYEFLVGIVPFMGDSPEELFANIINEEVDYPQGEEALDQDAESLIRLLLEKNPVDRLGTLGGAVQVTEHNFFAPMDFDSLLRQKAEFIPQLESEEDTSYFDSRSDRYNHEANESNEDEEAANVPMFWSFSTASPRHSIVGLELPTGSLAGLQALANAAMGISSDSQEEKREIASGAHGGQSELLRKFSHQAPQSSEDGSTGTPSTSSGIQSAFSVVGAHNGGVMMRQPSRLSDSQDSQGFLESGKLPPSSGSVGARSLDGALRAGDTNQPIPSAVILRRRFSTQRHSNLSTSSSGTTGTGPMNTCSSTDSSMDASHFTAIGMDSNRRHNTYSTAMTSPLPRFAISTCDQRTGSSGATLGAESDRPHLSNTELSPVEEGGVSSGGRISGPSMEKRPSTVVHELITDSAGKLQPMSRSARSASCRSDSLRVLIPSQYPSVSSSSSPAQTQAHSGSGGTTYYHSYGPTGGGAGSSGQLSPSCNSVSSASSFDSQSPNPNTAAGTGAGAEASIIIRANAPPPGGNLLTLPQSSMPGAVAQPVAHHPPSTSTQSKPIVIRKGPKGYGFTIRSVRVYLSEASDYYTIEHIVAAVRDPSPAFEAGLRENDLITHIHTQPVHNMTHPQLMHRLLSCGNEITLHVVPLNNTSIKEGEARRNVGKLLRKRPKGKPSRGRGAAAGLEKPGKSRKSSALLRRLSGKRAGEIVPGTSSQKQTFMPRSVSSQDGVLNVSPAASTSAKGQNLLEPGSAAYSQIGQSGLGGGQPPPPSPNTTKFAQQSASTDSRSYQHKRLSDFGLGGSLSSQESCTGSHVSHHPHQSPLVASSTSATITRSSNPQGKIATVKSPKPIADVQTQEEKASVSRPSTLQGLKNKVSQHLTPSSVSSTTSSGSVTMSTTAQPLSRKSSGGGKMPLSPLARQSSGGMPTGGTPYPQSFEMTKAESSVPRQSVKAETSAPRQSVPTALPKDLPGSQTKATRSPLPVRKISPSRIVQRLFRGTSKDVSSSSDALNPKHQ